MDDRQQICGVCGLSSLHWMPGKRKVFVEGSSEDLQIGVLLADCWWALSRACFCPH